MKCSRVNNPAKFAVLSNRQLPWKDGVLYWHLANFSDDMEKHQQVGIFKDVFQLYNHELWPLRFQSTDNISLADHKIFFVDEHDRVKGLNFNSPFAFRDEPDVIAVQYTYQPGFEFSMCMFVSDAHFFSYKIQEGSFALVKVILHEGLHALGLDHTDVKGDIMEAVYSDTNDFTYDSRAGLNKIHGAARRARVKADPSAAFLYPPLRKGIFSRLCNLFR